MALPPCLFLFLLSSALLVKLSDASSVACTESSECETILRKGSRCVDGLCTNPFYDGGCLKSLIPNWNRTRVCNSKDPPEAAALGYCRVSPFDYMEIRMGSGNWESVSLNGYLLQILLSELLDVPTTIESGHYDPSPASSSLVFNNPSRRIGPLEARSCFD